MSFTMSRAIETRGDKLIDMKLLAKLSEIRSEIRCELRHEHIDMNPLEKDLFTRPTSDLGGESAI